MSAFPLKDGSLLVSEGTSEVEHWNKGDDGKFRASVVYRGEYPVEYMEPDLDGRRMILVEDTGGRNLRAFVYSLINRSEWLTLIEDYKWVVASFTRKGEIAFGVGLWSSLLKPFPVGDDLLEEARQELSDRCIIEPKKTPTDSLCWKDLVSKSGDSR